MSKIFISHSSVNNAAALAIAQWLKADGWDDYFLDVTPSRGLAPGERWQEALKRAADRCEAVVFLISPAWRDSHWCRTELQLAKILGKAIFGVLIEPTPLDSLPKDMTAEWQLCDLVAGTQRKAFTVSLDPIVPETEVSFAVNGLDRLGIGLKRAGLDASGFPWPPPNDPERAPYRGLRALDVEDAAIYFGRDAAIVRGLDALRSMSERGTEQLFVILGASGSGKSSFLRAGLWPRLARDDRRFLPLPVIRPEREAINGPAGLLASLESAFRSQGLEHSRSTLRDALSEVGGLTALLDQLVSNAHRRLEAGAPAPTPVISIDQAEEMFAADAGPEGEQLLVCLSDSLALQGDQERVPAGTGQDVLVITAIRSDSYERLQTEPRLQSAVVTLFSLPPIRPTEFRAIIEQPAKRSTDAGRKLIIQPELIELLLGEPEGFDTLPLLAFTLERLFLEYGGDGDLLAEEYIAMGRIQGSIEAAAKAALASPERPPAIPSDPLEQQRLLRLAFLPGLAMVDPDTGDRKRRVATWDQLPQETLPLLDRLVAHRLLVRDRRVNAVTGQGEVVVEITHEALLRQWPLIRRWLDEEADALQAWETVRRTANEWVNRERNDAWLVHVADRLAFADAVCRRPDFAPLVAPAVVAYLDACRGRADNQRLEREAQIRQIADEQARVAQEQSRTARAQKWTKGMLFAVMLIIAISGGWIVNQTREVSRQTSLVLAGAAENANSAGRFDQALRYAMLATDRSLLYPTVVEADAQLARAAFGSPLRVALHGHEGAVHSASFSPDGTRVVTAASDMTARVWDATSGKVLAILRGHEDDVIAASFSPDGARVVSVSLDRTARVWDAASGKVMAILPGGDDRVGVASASVSPDLTVLHIKKVASASFSPDGARVVTGGPDSAARVWGAASGKVLATLRGHEDDVIAANFSPDGTRVVSVSGYGSALVWDAASGKVLLTLRSSKYMGRVASASFSPDSTRIVTALSDSTARVWDATSGKVLATLRGHEGAVSSANFSPDGTRVVSVSRDGSALVWDAASGKVLSTLGGSENGIAVTFASFSPDSTRIVTAESDKTARVWDATSGKVLATLRGHEGAVSSANFSADGTQVVTVSSDNTARVWDATNSKVLATLRASEDGVGWGFVGDSASFSPDGTRVVAAVSDKTARVWDATSGKVLTTLRGHQGDVSSAEFSPDGTRVVTAASDMTARVWDATSGKVLATLRGHEGDVSSANFSPDGTQVVTVSSDNTARVWDALSGKVLATLRGHEGGVSSANFSPDGTWIVTGAVDKPARAWDASSGKVLATLREYEDEGPVIREEHMNSANISPDGTRVVTAVKDDTARVWDATSGKVLATLRGHESEVNSASFSPDGTRVVTAAWDNTARIWDATSGKVLATLRGHEGAVNSANFSADGTRIVTAAWDGTARVWDTASGKVLATLRGSEDEGDVQFASFSPDGTRVLTVDSDDNLRVWDIRTLAISKLSRLRIHACDQRLKGASYLTVHDVENATILRSRTVGMDVCAR